MDIIDTALVADNIADFAKDHLRRYLATNGKEGHLNFQVINDGRPPAPPTLLLAARGRTSGKWYIWPLTYGMDGGRYLVVGSRGGAPEHPGWAKNLMANPDARIQVGDRRIDVTATVASGAERDRLWELMVKVLPEYSAYQKKTTRQLPVFVLTPKS